MEHSPYIEDAPINNKVSGGFDFDYNMCNVVIVVSILLLFYLYVMGDPASNNPINRIESGYNMYRSGNTMSVPCKTCS